MDLYEVKDVTTGINTVKDAENTVRNQVYSFFYGKTKSVKFKIAQYCKKNQSDVLQLVRYALSTVSNVLALGGDQAGIKYSNNREKLLKDLESVISGANIPRVEDFFSDSLNSSTENPRQIEVFYPNFIWDEDYLPIRITVARGLLVKYYNMVYAYFNNWKKVKEELYGIKPKVETTENTTNQKANESKSVVNNRKFLMEAEQTEESSEGLNFYRNFIEECKNSQPTTEELDRGKESFNEAFVNINRVSDIKTFGLSRQIGIFPPGDTNHEFRIEFGDDISARDKMTLLFKLPSGETSDWLNKMINFYKEFAAKVEKVGIEDIIMTNENSVTLNDSDIRETELEIKGKKETVYYVVVPENTYKVVLGKVENKVNTLNKISKDLIHDLKEGEVAYQVNKKSKKLISFENETGAKLSEEKIKEVTDEVLKNWLTGIATDYEAKRGLIFDSKFKTYVNSLTLSDLLNYKFVDSDDYSLFRAGIKKTDNEDAKKSLIEARAEAFNVSKDKAQFITLLIQYLSKKKNMTVRISSNRGLFKFLGSDNTVKLLNTRTYDDFINIGGEDLKNYFYKSTYVAAVSFDGADEKKYFINLGVKLGDLAKLTEGSDKLLDPTTVDPITNAIKKKEEAKQSEGAESPKTESTEGNK